MKKKISQREIDRRKAQSQAQWEKDNPLLVWRMERMREQLLHESSRWERARIGMY